MSQNPLVAFVAKNTSTAVFTSLKTDGAGNLIVVNDEGGELVTLNITTSTLVQTGPGRMGSLSVIVPGSATGTINDTTATSLAGAANQIYTTPTVTGVANIDWPITNGLVVVPGTGQTLAVTYRKP